MSFRGLKYWVTLVMLFVAMGSIGARPAFANDDGGRRIKSKVAPVYPDLARRMNVTGSVKVQIVIAPNGTVKSTKVIGGHPLLIEPSLDAVRKWRYEPSNEETIETVEFKFTGTE